MHMLGTFVLDASSANGGCSFERILCLMRERMSGLSPFRQRLVTSPFGFDQPVWIDDPELRIRSHLYRIAAPAARRKQAARKTSPPSVASN
jgi:hypothetical protein